MTLVLEGLREIANNYDALICDVWGVLHDGRQAHGGARDMPAVPFFLFGMGARTASAIGCNRVR